MRKESIKCLIILSKIVFKHTNDLESCKHEKETAMMKK